MTSSSPRSPEPASVSVRPSIDTTSADQRTASSRSPNQITDAIATKAG